MKLSSRKKGKLRRKAKYWAQRQHRVDEWVEIHNQLIAEAVRQKRR